MQLEFSLRHNALVRDALASAAQYLDTSGAYFGHGTDSAWDESVMLLLWVMGFSDDPGESVLEQPLTPEESDKFISVINQRATEKLPAAYIIGEAWFCGLRFYVDERVLVPRSPIAELIQNAYRPWIKSQPKRILDLCCGSGCIGIAAAVYDDSSEVVLADLSTDALEVAEKNIERHRIEKRVVVCESNLFDRLGSQKFDLILCNPPYVDHNDLATMPSEYLREPSMALGSGEDGLDLTRQILKQADNYLADDGIMVLEVGNSSVHLERAFPEFPFTWACFANGGDGVCVLTKLELMEGGF